MRSASEGTLITVATVMKCSILFELCGATDQTQEAPRANHGVPSRLSRSQPQDEKHGLFGQGVISNNTNGLISMGYASTHAD